MDIAKREIEDKAFVESCNELAQRITKETPASVYIDEKFINVNISILSRLDVKTNYGTLTYTYHFNGSKESQNKIHWLLGELLSVTNVPDYKRVRTRFLNSKSQ